MPGLLMLMFGGRKAREAYRDETDALRELAAANRALAAALRESRNAKS